MCTRYSSDQNTFVCPWRKAAISAFPAAFSQQSRHFWGLHCAELTRAIADCSAALSPLRKHRLLGLEMWLRVLSLLLCLGTAALVQAFGPFMSPLRATRPVVTPLARMHPLLAKTRPKIDLSKNVDNLCRIKVIGVGGGGGNAVNRMVQSGVQGVEFWAVNTDAQALSRNLAPHKLHIGTTITR